MDRDAVAQLNFQELLTFLHVVLTEFVNRVGVSVTVCGRTYHPTADANVPEPEAEAEQHHDNGGPSPAPGTPLGVLPENLRQ